MRRVTLLGLAAALTLTGCARVAESRFNPMNWFGRSQEAAIVDPAERRPLIPANRQATILDGRALVQSVTELRVDRTPTGAIVRATGLAPTQGYFNAELVNAGISNGVLSLQFRAQAPAGFEPQGTPRSRQINAAYVIDIADLTGIRTIRVEAESNARTSGR